MSKRDGEAAVAVGDWRRAGYVPEALISYLALLGFHPGDDREILSRAELIEAFTLDRVGKSGSVFDPDKLKWMNGHLLHVADGSHLLAWAQPFLPDAVRALPQAQLEALLAGARGDVDTLADVPRALAPFIGDAIEFEPAAAEALDSEGARDLCRALAEQLDPLAEWSGEVFKSAVQSVGRARSLKGKALFQPVRAALTGRTHGPELPVVAELLGRERVLARLAAAASGRVGTR
jgi:glutamyl/glutaminyl-tRNA synthetase